MKVKAKLNDIRTILDDPTVSINLFFITREIKEGVAKSAKVIDKYCFKAWSVDVSPDLVKFFINVAKKQVNRVNTSDDYELEPYSVIGDDLSNKLYTYALNNALSFSDVVSTQLVSGTPKSITSLAQIKSDLWAYTLKFTTANNSALIFRKLSKGKVVTADPQSMTEKVSSFFDSNTSELKVSIQESISFDDKLDCIYINSEFLIFHKSGFENIVGMEEEFKEAASGVLDIIKETGLIEGIEHIEQQLKVSRALLKTLSNIGKKGNHQSFDANELEKMKSVLHQFEGKELKMTDDGKLLIEDKNDVGYFIKLLNDYYKQGMVSGKFYGTNGGQLLVVNS